MGGTPSASATGGSVTLIFRRIERRWRDEYLLNLAAAFATGGDISHVEMAIGNEAGADGHQMSNVLRIFNDNVGVELCNRTGKHPNFQYLQIGCTKEAEHKMLEFARAQVGKPFNSWAMARSIIWPRKTNYRDYFCAELVAATLKVGGVMSKDSNPAAATPQSLFQLYERHATTTGNPCVLRTIASSQQQPPPRNSRTFIKTHRATTGQRAPPRFVPAHPQRMPYGTYDSVGALHHPSQQFYSHQTPQRPQPPPLSHGAQGHTLQTRGITSPAEELIRKAVRGACAKQHYQMVVTQ
jgi:hypothetical protein